MKLAFISSLFACTVMHGAHIHAAITTINTPSDQSISQTNLYNVQQPISASDSVAKGWTIDGSFLFWNAKIEGLAYAQSVSLSGDLSSVPIHIDVMGDIEAVSCNHWDPGFQLGIGYIFPQREQWHTRLAWTRFNTTNDESIKVSNPDLSVNFIAPLWFSLLTGPIASKASAKWDLDFDTLDLELDRSFFIGKWLSFSPRIGIRAAWIDQNYHVKYSSFYPTGSTIFAKNTFFKTHQTFKGVGLKIGSDIEFYLSKAWSILGNLSTSLLWGKARVKENLNGLIIIDPMNSLSEDISFKNKADVLRTCLEGLLGLQWQTFFHEDKFRVACSASYSFAYWFKQNNMLNEVSAYAPSLSQPGIQPAFVEGDLQIQGLNLKLGLDF